MATNTDIDCPAKNMQKKVVVRNANTAILHRDLTTTMQQKPERKHVESLNSSEVQVDKDAEIPSSAHAPQMPSLPDSPTVTSYRQLEQLKILLQTEVQVLVTRSVDEVKCLLQEEVHGRIASERRLDERCDRLAEAVQATSQHALQATQSGNIEQVASMWLWIKDRLDKLDIKIAQAVAPQAVVQPVQSQEVFDTRIADLEEHCKHLEMAGMAQIEVMEQQQKWLEEHCMNLEKISVAREESSGHDNDLVDASKVKHILEGVKEQCDILKKSLTVLPTDATATVPATVSSAHDRIDGLKAVVQESFDRFLQESESVKNCWRLRKAAESSGKVVAMHSPGHPQQLKSEQGMQQSADKVVVTVQPVAPRACIDGATQQPIEQCRKEVEASVIELPAQTASKNASRANSSSLAWAPKAQSFTAGATSPPKAQSYSAGAMSPSCTHQAVPALQLPSWAAQTPRDNFMCKIPSKEYVQGAVAIQAPSEHFLTRSSSKERMVPASSPARPRITSPHSGGRSSSLDARPTMPWPLSPKQQQLPQQQFPQQGPQEQKAQSLVLPMSPITSPPTAAMSRENTMDLHAAPLATPLHGSWASLAPTPSTTAMVSEQLRAASPVGTPQMQSPRALPRETVRACGVRSPSMDPSYAQILGQPPQRMRGSLGGSLGLRARR